MNRGINIISLMLLVLTISCTKDSSNQFGSEQVVGNKKLQFGAFNTKATAAEEDVVKRVRVVIFDSPKTRYKGQLLCNQLAIPDESGYIQPVNIKPGVRDIYLIINEPQADNDSTLDEYDKITSVADIEALELAYASTASDTPYRPSNIPMFDRHLNVTIHEDMENIIVSKVLRMMAKVTMNLNIEHDNFSADKHPVINTITIKNLPGYSYVIAQAYTGDLTTSETQTATQMATQTTTQTATKTEVSAYDYSSTNIFYVPEYILASADHNSYIEIIGHVNGGTEILKWTVPLGKAEQGTGFNNITRNNHYFYTCNVKSYGEHDVDIEMNVLPWNYVPISGGDGTYLLVENKDKRRTLRFTIADTIKLMTNDIDNVIVSSQKSTIDIKKVDNELHVSRLEYFANEEFEDNIDAVIIKHKNQTIEIPINYEPCMAQRFAKGMLVMDGANGVKIGAPNADSKTHLGFRFGLPIGVRLDAELQAAALIAYNPVGWTGGTKIPSPDTDETTYYGENIDYLEHKMNAAGRTVTKDANGVDSVYGYAGDVCRIMGKDSDNHYWRIPKAQEWQDLLAEGKLITAMNDNTIETDFGWFLGPTASDLNNKPEAPVKGSTFVYNMRFAFENLEYYRTDNNKTLNVQSSSFHGLNEENKLSMYYLTCSTEVIRIFQYPQSYLFCSVRCIRDYKRENAEKLN